MTVCGSVNMQAQLVRSILIEYTCAWLHLSGCKAAAHTYPLSIVASQQCQWSTIQRRLFPGNRKQSNYWWRLISDIDYTVHGNLSCGLAFDRLPFVNMSITNERHNSSNWFLNDCYHDHVSIVP